MQQQSSSVDTGQNAAEYQSLSSSCELLRTSLLEPCGLFETFSPKCRADQKIVGTMGCKLRIHHRDNLRHDEINNNNDFCAKGRCI
jgi:hypothetical protein